MGYDKARLRFPGGPLLERVLGRMEQVASPVVLSLAAGQAPPALSDARAGKVIVVRDSDADQGPLQGLLEGFRALARQCARVVVMPVDMPFFTEDCLRRLLAGLEGHMACQMEHEGFVNALTAAYDLSLLERLEGLVAEGLRRPVFLSEGQPTRVIEAETPPRGGHPMQDVDTPESYREALLEEGVGEAGGADVTVIVDTVATDTVAPDTVAMDTVQGERDFIALHAHTAAGVMNALQNLYPELQMGFPPRSGGLMLFDLEGREPGDDPGLFIQADLIAGSRTPLPPETPMRPGQSLALIMPAESSSA